MSFPQADIQAIILGATIAVTGIDGRVWRNRFPQKGAGLPRVLWSRTGSTHNGTHDTASSAAASRIEITCEGRDEDEVTKLSETIKENLDGYRSDGVIQGIVFEDSNDDPEPPQEGAEIGFARVRMRAMFAHSE